MESKAKGNQKVISLPKEIEQRFERWHAANATVGKNVWQRAGIAYELHKSVQKFNDRLKPEQKLKRISWSEVCRDNGQNRATLNDDVCAWTLLLDNKLSPKAVPAKSYSLFVKLQRLKSYGVTATTSSKLQPFPKETAVDEVEGLIDRHAQLTAMKDSPVRLADVRRLLEAKLIEVGVKKEQPIPSLTPKVKPDINVVGKKDCEDFLAMLKEEFEGPGYRGCSVGVATATTEDLEANSIEAALDALKAPVSNIVPPRGQVWICLRRQIENPEQCSSKAA